VNTRNEYVRHLKPHQRLLIIPAALKRLAGLNPITLAMCTNSITSNRRLPFHIWQRKTGGGDWIKLRFFSRAKIRNRTRRQVRLFEAIPLPDKEVLHQDILEFRTKYCPELLTLRYHLDTINQRIVAAGDGERALNSELGAL
jgi:hypothetical protein